MKLDARDRYTLPSQQHFYMETQAAVVRPTEGGSYTIHASTQTLDGIQSAAARALGISAHNITAGKAFLDQFGKKSRAAGSSRKGCPDCHQG